jgi:tetratricopeptide (TPR) repeat protein
MKSGARNFLRVASCFLILALGATGAGADETPPPGSITLTQRQAVELAARLIARNDFSEAAALLTKQPFTVLELEIERLYLLGQIALKEKRYEDAIEIYRYILDHQPNLPKIRLELALAYMATEQWYRADHHMRLAASDESLPPEVKLAIRRYLYTIRQNKNWNLWFNFGLAPDNNVNGAVGGEECITYSQTFGHFPYPLCRKLPEPEKAMGYNLGFGGDYEFKFGEHWRLKNDFALLANLYDKSQYDVYYLSASSGPRYVFPRGDVWLAATGHKMYYGGRGYRDSLGLKLETNYDFLPRLSGNLQLHWRPTRYDGERADYMNGEVRGANMRLAYYFDASRYAVLKAGLDREDTKEEAYSNLRKSLAVGFGAEVPLGFRVYLEPSFAWTDYDGPRWTVAETAHGSEYTQVVEKLFTQRYMVSLSNNKISFLGFTPVVSYAYTDRKSNINSRSYEKHDIGFTMQQRF